MSAETSRIQITWSDPVHVVTKHGKKKWVRHWLIPFDLLEGFFIFWERQKDVLKFKGYSINKNEHGRWILNEWQVRKTDFRKSFGKDNVKELFDPETIPTVSNLPEYKVKDVSGLREWQAPIVAQLCSALKIHKAAIDGSDTGAGKTYVATAVARELGMKIGVVCPKSVISSWKKVITKHFGLKAEFVLNYESVKTGNHKDIGIWESLSRTSSIETFRWNVPADTLIIFDESHRLKGHGTQNSELARSAKKQKYHILCCSATNAISPLDLKTTGYVLGLYKGSFTDFMKNHGCVKMPLGWMFEGDQTVLKKLHADLFLERGVRIRKEDIKGFPDCEIIAESYDVAEGSEAEINTVYEEMNRELEMLRITCKNTAQWKINALTIQLRARQRAELLKVPLFIEMTEDSLEDGMSVAVFMNFSESIKALSKRLKTNCIIWGNNKGDERDKNIEAFQSDEQRIILVNIKAGGTGLSLHDLKGKYPRIALISPPLSAIELKQALGRIHRDGALSKALQKIIFVANTEEEKTCERLRSRLKNLDTINDGELFSSSVLIEKS